MFDMESAAVDLRCPSLAPCELKGRLFLVACRCHAVGMRCVVPIEMDILSIYPHDMLVGEDLHAYVA